jgi:hypothetical protein
MKSVLGCLMCLVITMSQSFAISGGPFGRGVNVVGTYAGVIKAPRLCLVCDSGQQTQINCKDFDSYKLAHPGATSGPCGSPVPDCSLNSLGVFSVGVPSTGISSGTFVMFSQGRVFSGTIRGTADPGTAMLTGVLNATFDFTVTNNNRNPPTTESFTASANGNLKTKISNAQTTLGVAATRLAGTATLGIDLGFVNPDNTPLLTCQTSFKVVGFKQSNTAPTSSG